ncbi:MAG: hypothetical protein VXW32_12410 [Myxococcota bacterium]|nr:hypothetical protein [Myxococcota bacterium]
MRSIATSTALIALATAGIAHAEEADSDFAQYGVRVGVSPFGGSFNFGYNSSEKTTYSFGLGGLPSTDSEMTIDGTDYTRSSESVWAGVFVNHRPFDNAQWLRLNAGLCTGKIVHTLTEGDNEYKVEYLEVPVGYMGLGFGLNPKKGFQIGLDIGGLFGAGAAFSQTEGDANKEALDAISENALFSLPFLPNALVNVGWGF